MAARLFSSPETQHRPTEEPLTTEKQLHLKQRRLTDFICKQETTDAEGSAAFLRPVSSAMAPTTPVPQVRKYRPRGTCRTFAGRRPPKDEERLKKFLQEREEHMQKLQETAQGGKRQATNPQQDYREFLKAMLPQETQGTAPQRLRRVAAKWQNRQSMQEKLVQENKSVL